MLCCRWLLLVVCLCCIRFHLSCLFLLLYFKRRGLLLQFLLLLLLLAVLPILLVLIRVRQVRQVIHMGLCEAAEMAGKHAFRS
jgi:hypothetical protein